jgi:hypothetical protein
LILFINRPASNKQLDRLGEWHLYEVPLRSDCKRLRSISNGSLRDPSQGLLSKAV